MGRLRKAAMEPKVPDFLPYLRLCGPISRSVPLREARSTLPVNISTKFRQQLSEKTIVDLRLLINFSNPQARVNDPEPVPGEIVARRKFAAVVMEARLNPKWVKFKGCFLNQVPLDITAMVLEKSPAKGPLKCEIEIELDFLNDSRASGVAELFISRQIEPSVLRRSIVASQPFERDVAEMKQASLVGSGIDSWIVSLKCPLLAVRMNTPVRFEQCQHLECFDLDAFIAMEMKRPKGRCPVCNRLVEVRTLAVCAFTTSMLKENPDCESYRISEAGIRPVSNEEKKEVIGSRKRKRAILEEIPAESRNDEKRRCEKPGPGSGGSKLKPPNQVSASSYDCVVILDD